MSNVNRVIISGNLGSDPTLSENSTKIFLCSTHTYVERKTGNRIKKTLTANLLAFGKLGDLLGDFRKGDFISVEGRLNRDTVLVEHIDSGTLPMYEYSDEDPNEEDYENDSSDSSEV